MTRKVDHQVRSLDPLIRLVIWLQDSPSTLSGAENMASITFASTLPPASGFLIRGNPSRVACDKSPRREDQDRIDIVTNRCNSSRLRTLAMTSKMVLLANFLRPGKSPVETPFHHLPHMRSLGPEEFHKPQRPHIGGQNLPAIGPFLRQRIPRPEELPLPLSGCRPLPSPTYPDSAREIQWHIIAPGLLSKIALRLHSTFWTRSTDPWRSEPGAVARVGKIGTLAPS
jgi:hypothetical protein